MKKITVEIERCYKDHGSWKSTHLAIDNAMAFEKALKKHFGKHVWFANDYGLRDQGLFGQVVSQTGSCLTGRVCVQFEGVAK